MRLDSQAIGQLLQQVVRKLGLPHISVHLTLCGESVTVTAGTLQPQCEWSYELACIKKLLTSLIALDLVARRQLSLDACILDYLPELQGTPGAAGVRLWHLLSNTSGFSAMELRTGREPALPSRAQLFEFLRRAPQIFLPGTVFSYQLQDYWLVTEILTRVTGQELRSLARERLLEPLQIDTGAQPAPRYRLDLPSRTFQLLDDGGTPIGADGLAMEALTTTGLGKLAAALAGASPRTQQRPAPLAGAPLLFDRKLTIPVAVESALAPYVFRAYGLGCGEYADGVMGHSGTTDGHCCTLRFDASRQFSVAMTVSAAAPQLRDRLLTAILRLCGYPPAARPSYRPPARFHPDELIGNYFGGDDSPRIEIRRHGEELVCPVPRSGPVAEGARDCREAVFVFDNGTPRLHPNSRQVAAVFFRDPASDTPCLMLGGRAFKQARC